MELTLYRLEFDVDRTSRRINVLTNIEQFGLSMESIFDDWINHSADITPDNFSKFIRSKDKGIICITEEEYNELYAE